MIEASCVIVYFHFLLDGLAGKRALAVGKVKTEMPTVLTIGHSTRTWKAFLDLLRGHRVKCVIDVRTIPRSRRNPQFNRETLRTKLRGARIGYVHLRKLGGDAILRTWAGAIPRFVDSPITCRPRNSTRGYRG
jgi:Protein of unknown function, DUF488